MLQTPSRLPFCSYFIGGVNKARVLMFTMLGAGRGPNMIIGERKCTQGTGKCVLLYFVCKASLDSL
jgi:hypothetical protein